jgi:hypothetical protein
MTDVNASNDAAGSSLALIPEMITSPSTALDKIWQHGAPWWLPYLIVLCSTAAVWVLYYAQLDYEWFMAYSTSHLSGEEQTQTLEGMQSMSANALMGITVVSIAIMMTAFCLINALFLMITNRVSGTPMRSFKQWLSITTWTALPSVFIALGGFLTIMMNTSGELAPESLSLTNLNNLVFHASKTDQLFTFYNTIDLVSLWGMALIMMALIKNGQSKIASFIIAITPQAIISTVAFI